MAEKFVKPIREKGIVISKVINKAREAGQSFDGTRKWDARPEEFIVTVLSCDEDDFNKLMDIMELAGELTKRAPYDKLVNNKFAERIK